VQATQVDPEQAKRITLVVWITLLASQGIYVALLLSGFITHAEPLHLPILPMLLGGVALGTAVGSHVCWRRAWGAGRAIHEAQPDPGTSFTSYLLSWMLDETVAIYGLVLGLLGFALAVWIPFSIAGFVLMLMHRPS